MKGGAFWSNGSLRVCSCASPPKPTKRLFAMSGIIGNGALQMYAEAALATLRARGGLPWDTLQLSEQMQGHGSRSWAIEIWDVRYLPERAPSILSLETAPRSFDDTRCEPAASAHRTARRLSRRMPASRPMLRVHQRV